MSKSMITLLDILFALIVFGALWFALGKNILGYFKNVRSKRKRLALSADKSANKGVLSRLLSFDAITGLSADNIIILCVIVFIISLVTVTYFTSINMMTIMVSLVVGIMPLIIKRIRLEELRLKGSYDGEKIIISLLNNYHMHNKDMELAIDTIAVTLENPYSRRIFTKLALDIKTANTAERTTEVLEEMHFAYNTNWSMILKHAIFSAVWDGEDVTPELNKIIEMFKKVNETNEGTKRYNNEAFVILRIFIPMCYVVIMWYGGRIYGFTLFEMIKKQFEIPLAFQMFIAAVILYIVAIIYGRLIKLGKYDL